MIVGTVQPNGDAVISVRLKGPGAATMQLSVVVDTGFNDSLALPPDIITSLALPFREEGTYTLADGAVAVSRIFTGQIEWFGSWRRILVVEMGGGPLLGMSLL